MKKSYTLLFLIIITLSSLAQYTRGTVQEGLSIESKILGKTIKYTIYLPFDYESSDRYYPVTYLLHGYGDNDMGWMQFGEAHLIADEAIATREIPSMILAMPDGGTSFYINNYDQSLRYEDFFMEEFIPFIEKTYRARAEKRYRGIAGLSMGGFGTLNFALKYPEKFAACAAFSSAVFSEEYLRSQSEEKINQVYAPVFGPEFKSGNELSKHYHQNNPFDVTREKGKEAYNNLHIYIDCGDDDFLTSENCRLHIHLTEMGIKHEFRMRDGIHSWSYWRSALPVGLKFIGESFHQ